MRDLGATQVVSPNHGWQHRLKTAARSMGNSEAVIDTIHLRAAIPRISL